RRLGVAGRRLRLLRLGLGLDAADALTLAQLGQLDAFALALLVLGLLGVGLEAVDAAPAGLERDLAPGAEALALDLRHHGRPRVAGRRMEHGEEAPGDEVEDAPLVGRELRNVVLDVGRDDRVVVFDARVRHDAPER